MDTYHVRKSKFHFFHSYIGEFFKNSRTNQMIVFFNFYILVLTYNM